VGDRGDKRVEESTRPVKLGRLGSPARAAGTFSHSLPVTFSNAPPLKSLVTYGISCCPPGGRDPDLIHPGSVTYDPIYPLVLCVVIERRFSSRFNRLS